MCSWREKIRAWRGMIEVGAVISGHTTHGSFVSPGLFTLLPPGPALMHAVVCSDIFSDILF